MKNSFINLKQPLVIRILQIMQDGKIYQAMPISIDLNVDTQAVKNALCNLCLQNKITRVSRGSYKKL